MSDGKEGSGQTSTKEKNEANCELVSVVDTEGQRVARRRAMVQSILSSSDGAGGESSDCSKSSCGHHPGFLKNELLSLDFTK